MTKQEEIRGRQICEAAKKNGAGTTLCELAKSKLSRCVNSATGIGFIEGAVWADKNPIHYDGQAMLYVLHKGVEQGKKAMLEKAIEWLRNETMGLMLQPKENSELVQEFIDSFKEAMKDN